jgi:hypothetical protein
MTSLTTAPRAASALTTASEAPSVVVGAASGLRTKWTHDIQASVPARSTTSCLSIVMSCLRTSSFCGYECLRMVRRIGMRLALLVYRICIGDILEGVVRSGEKVRLASK